MILYGHLCESAQETVYAYVECTEEEQKQSKDDQCIRAAFLHINECMNTTCELAYYHIWNERSKQSRPLRFLMRMVRKQRPMLHSPLRAVKDILSEYTPSYPPSRN